MAACSSETIYIQDLSRSYVTELVSSRHNPGTIRLNIRGESDGSFTLMGLTFPKGKIDTSLVQPWETPRYNLIYEPIRARQGKLEITYQF